MHSALPLDAWFQPPLVRLTSQLTAINPAMPTPATGRFGLPDEPARIVLNETPASPPTNTPTSSQVRHELVIKCLRCREDRIVWRRRVGGASVACCARRRGIRATRGSSQGAVRAPQRRHGRLVEPRRFQACLGGLGRHPQGLGPRAGGGGGGCSALDLP